jgi:hypothetical protein
MLVLIVDDAYVWLQQGETMMFDAGHQTLRYLVTDPKALQKEPLPAELEEKLAKCDVLLVDNDIGKGLDTAALCCIARKMRPKLPIIRWTSGWGRDEWPRLLGVTTVAKPTRRRDHETKKTMTEMFPEVFAKAFAEQVLILGGAAAILADVQCRVRMNEGDADRDETRARRLRDLEQIAKLAEDGVTETPVLDERGRQKRDYNWRLMFWSLSGEDIGYLEHELGHAICDGVLTPAEIEPFLPALQKVVKKFGEISDRFRICAEFLLNLGPAEEVVFIQGCY